jgi:hypothetical protein
LLRPRDGSTAVRDWWLPVALVLLTAIPFIAGNFRLAEVAAGVVTDENARLLLNPLPLVLHIVASGLFSVVGALQFAPRFRRQFIRWHRLAGRVLVLCGLVSGVTGLWMNQFFAPGEQDGALLYWFRVIFGAGMIMCLIIGWTDIRGRNVQGHRAWISRAYAIGQGAGTQALVHMAWMLFFPLPGETERAWLMGGGWIINVAVVESVLRRSRPVPRRGVVQV